MTAAEIRHYDDLIAALKHRADACALSNGLLDDLSGLPSGYTGKLFGPARVRMVGLDSLWPLLEALALRMTIEPDLEAAQRMAVKWERRMEGLRRTGVLRRHWSPEVRDKILSEAGRITGSLGGHARALSLSPKQRSAIAKKAARVRWKRAHSARAAVAQNGGAPING